MREREREEVVFTCTRVLIFSEYTVSDSTISFNAEARFCNCVESSEFRRAKTLTNKKSVNGGGVAA